MTTYPFRLLKTGFHNGFYNMGLDEALLEAVAQGGSPPVLRLYGWDPAAVSVGYFQGLEEEVDLGACAAHEVDVVRRISGGGAVFHQAELTYSSIMPIGHPLAGEHILESYKRLCTGIIQALALMGVPAEFAPINDILAGGKKISGNAQTRRMGCVLQHGTVLLDLDVGLMFELLRVPAEKVKDKQIRDVQERVTSLNALLGRVVSYGEVEAALAEGFCRALSLDYIEGQDGILPEEARALELAAGKFAAPAWLHKSPAGR
ncbi:MAG: lipoate--protein ligase family protein [Treponema sp.]|jgi:lipoate-protein ligase A|nr:lipoate--protein ligase family protein [Treponema sp.]